MDIWQVLGCMGLPTAITGLFFWLLQRKITKAESQREARQTAQEQLQLRLLESTSAAIALGEATAKAVQRIPDAHCNGDMHKALDYAAEVKHRQKDFLQQQGIHAIFDTE